MHVVEKQYERLSARKLADECRDFSLQPFLRSRRRVCDAARRRGGRDLGVPRRRDYFHLTRDLGIPRRVQQVLQRIEHRQVRFKSREPLRAATASNAATRAARAQAGEKLFDQRRLSGARFAGHRQQPPLTRCSAIESAYELRTLFRAADGMRGRRMVTLAHRDDPGVVDRGGNRSGNPQSARRGKVTLRIGKHASGIANGAQLLGHRVSRCRSFRGLLGQRSPDHAVHRYQGGEPVSGGGCSWSVAWRISRTVRPANAGRPESISNKMAPAANRSLRASTASPFTCSGAM